MNRPITAAAILVTMLVCAAAAPFPRAAADAANGRLTPATVGNGKIAFGRWTVTNGVSNMEIFTMNADGSGETNLTNNTKVDSEPDWSPNGKIAFERSDATDLELFAMNADGSGETQLTNNQAADGEPAWSPDGTKIAFYRLTGGNREIFVMNADGSGQTKLTNNPADDQHPTWSPDGTKIAFQRWSLGAEAEIYAMNADGSGPMNLTNDAAWDGYPAWSPDGTKIAFSRHDEVFVMNTDGSGQTNLTNAPGWDRQPTWSPDGTKIAFDRDSSIYVMNADGSGQTKLTDTSDDSSADWQALPTTTCSGGSITLVDAGPASPYPSTCSIPAMAGSIADVNVQLNRLSHTYPDDLDLLLVAPNGDNAIFMSDAGTLVDVVNCTLKIDDEAATTLPDSNGIACPGSYKPANYGVGDPFPAPAPVPSGRVKLSSFHGGTPSGTWSLYAVDDMPGDTGHLTSWKLTITVQP